MKKILLIIAFLIFEDSNAQNVFNDDFAAYFTGVDLSGQGTWTHNSSSPGGLGAAVGAIPNNADVIASPISYLNYGESNNAIAISPDSDGCGTAFPAQTGDTYFGFVLNLSVAQANNNSDFFRVMSGNNFNTSFRLYATPAPGAFFIGVVKAANGNQINFTPNALGYNQDHLIIVKYTQASGTNDDVVSVYIDPVFNDGQPSNATVSSNVGLDQSGSLDRLTFRLNWTNGMPTGKAGLVSIANTWNDLSFFNLNTNQFGYNNVFTIDSSKAKNGLLSIKSVIEIENATLKVFTVNGTLITNQKMVLSNSNTDIRMSPLQNSVYIVEVTDSKGKRFTQKILVN